MKSTYKNLQILLVLLCAACCSAPAFAQSDEIETQFRQINAEEDKKLRAVLAEPIPEGASPEVLRKHFNEKDAAAVRLGEPGIREGVLTQAVARLPDARLKFNLGRQLIKSGQTEKGNALVQQAIAGGRPFDVPIMRASMAFDLYEQNNNEAARKTISANLQEIKNLEPLARQNWQQRELARSLARNYRCLSLIEQRFGKNGAAISAAIESEKFARRAMELASPADSPTLRQFLRSDLADSLARKLTALRAAGRISDAELVLADYMRLSSEQELPAGYLSGIYAVASGLRFVQREFAQAETMARKSDAVLARLGYDALSGGRPNRASSTANALIGQKNWPAALTIYNQLDTLAGNDDKLKARVLFRFDRALAYLGDRKSVV